MRRAAAVWAATLLAGCATTPEPDRAYLRQFAAATRADLPFAPVTDTQPTLSLDQAYRVQRLLVTQRVAAGDRVAGYKGGLMSAASMQARNIAEPLVGVLFRSGAADDGDTISLCGYRKASFEMKIGYVFARAVAAPKDDATIAGAVARIVPVIDLPDIAYRNPDRYAAVDMVAANISAARFVRGASASTATPAIDTIRVAMTRDGSPLTAGLTRESLDGQWASLATLVRLILRSGRTVAAGDLVITGKIGNREWLTPGAYRADYGPLGAVRFTVAPCPR